MYYVLLLTRFCCFNVVVIKCSARRISVDGRVVYFSF